MKEKYPNWKVYEFENNPLPIIEFGDTFAWGCKNSYTLEEAKKKFNRQNAFVMDYGRYIPQKIIDYFWSK